MMALPESRARDLLLRYNISSPDGLRDLEAIANAEGLIIEDAPLANCQGKIVYDESCGLIRISTAIREAGTKRFTIAHEMGHFFNEKPHFNNCTRNDLLPVRSHRTSENNANAFAVELLMKREWYMEFVENRKPGIDTIEAAAEFFGVSLSAAAIRYSLLASVPTAVIMSRNRKVLWVSINKRFPYRFTRREYSASLSPDPSDIASGNEIHQKPIPVITDTWSPKDRSSPPPHVLTEECLFMPTYDAVLSLVWEETIIQNCF